MPTEICPLPQNVSMTMKTAAAQKRTYFQLHYNTNYFNNDCCFDIFNHSWVFNRWRTPFLTNVFCFKPQKHAENYWIDSLTKSLICDLNDYLIKIYIKSCKNHCETNEITAGHEKIIKFIEIISCVSWYIHLHFVSEPPKKLSTTIIAPDIPTEWNCRIDQ